MTKIKQYTKQDFNQARQELITKGYTPLFNKDMSNLTHCVFSKGNRAKILRVIK